MSTLAIAGSVMKHSCMLICYSGLLFVIMLGELALGIVAITGREKVQHRAQIEMVRAMSHYNSKIQTRSGVDIIQKRLKCCGLRDYRDWIAVLGRPEVPRSCCVNESACDRTYNVTKNSYVRGIRKKGCWSAIVALIRSNEGIFAGLALSVCFLQVLGILFGVLLAHRVRHPPDHCSDEFTPTKFTDGEFFEDEEDSDYDED